MDHQKNLEIFIEIDVKSKDFLKFNLIKQKFNRISQDIAILRDYDRLIATSRNN